MTFDPSTATLEFDPSTATPVEASNSQRSVGDFLLNKLPSSAIKETGEIVSGAYQTVRHPLQTAKGLGLLALGAAERTSPLVWLLKKTGVAPETIGHESYFDVVASEAEKAYGTPRRILDTLYEDPIGVASDLSMFMLPKAGVKGAQVVAESGAVRKAMATPGAVERLTAQAKQAEATKKVSQLLPDLKLEQAIKEGGTAKSQVEAAKLIKKTKNPQDIVNNFAIEQGKVMAERDALVMANNRPIPLKAVAERAKLILKRDIDNATSKDAMALRQAFKDELSSNAYKGEFDAVKANKRKSYLYEETHPAQKKQASGISITMAPESVKVKDAFAQALKELVEQAHPDIKNLNARWGAIEEAKTAAAKLTERLTETKPENLLQRATGYVLGRLSPQQSAAAAVREASYVIKGRKGTVESLTRDIEKLAKQAQEASYKSRLKQMERLIKPEDKGRALSTVKPERGFTMKDVEPKAPTEGGFLTGESRKGLTGPSKRESLTGPKKQGLLGHDIGAGFLTKEQALKENPLFGYQIKSGKKVIGDPVGGLRSSELSKGGFNRANLKKSVRDSLDRFNKRNRIK